MAGRRGQRGAVTAELALALPLLLAVCAALVWLLSVGYCQVRMVDAARETARALARGEDPATAIALGQRVAPDGARFSVSSTEGHVVVTVKGSMDGPGSRLPFTRPIHLTASAVAASEGGEEGQ